ncbi:hypothetical protein O6H91_05G025600 [Diphasiastrum complanatum]|uniref:Uncharacterized protein n=1 Tax=Diphasiastrum complanatum TaxID=34168 RepID=A0ACC2DLZ3_DIPCM|nr:hypothetical protein O6H91_05G025600 [Diphasiastrum complanatum]
MVPEKKNRKACNPDKCCMALLRQACVVACRCVYLYYFF